MAVFLFSGVSAFWELSFLLQEVGNLFFEKGIEALTLLSHITFLFVFGYYFFRQKELLHRWVFSFAAAGTIALGYSKFYIVLFTRMHSDIVTDWIALGGATLLAIAAVFLWPFIYRLIAIPERGVLLEINNALQGELKQSKRKEHQLSEDREHLEKLVNERTSELVTITNRLKEEIVERQSLEASEKDLKERFECAVRGANDGLWDWPDVTRSEMWFSPRFYELLGYEPGQLQGSIELMETLCHPEDLPRVKRAITKHVSGDVPLDMQARIQTQSGDYCWFRCRGVSLRNGEGNVIRISGAITDISRQKKTEEDLRRYMCELEESRDYAEEGSSSSNRIFGYHES